jgi:hypothetical protein
MQAAGLAIATLPLPLAFTLCAASEQPSNEERQRMDVRTLDVSWLDQDAAYIVTDAERCAFARLQTDDEREQFIENFWLRRDPTPVRGRKGQECWQPWTVRDDHHRAATRPRKARRQQPCVS